MDAILITEKLGWHRTSWATKLALNPDINKVYLVDPSRENVDLIRQGLTSKFAGVYDSPEEVFANFNPKLALITMAPLRMPDAIKLCLEKGIHVLVEKPGAVSPDVYKPLVDFANSKKLLLTMALIADTPFINEARKCIQEGILGKIYGINELTTDHQRWRRHADFGWVFNKKEAGGGILAHLACHKVHGFRRIMGEEIVEVTGFADSICNPKLSVEDNILLNVRFESGAVGILHAAYWGPGIYQPVETEVIEIKGNEAILDPAVLPTELLNDNGVASQPAFFRIWGEYGTIFADYRTGDFIVDLIQNSKGEKGNIGLPNEKYSIHREKRNLTQKNPLSDPFLTSFIDAIKGNCQPPNSNEDGLKFLQIQQALYDASSTGRTQKLH